MYTYYKSRFAGQEYMSFWVLYIPSEGGYAQSICKLYICTHVFFAFTVYHQWLYLDCVILSNPRLS